MLNIEMYIQDETVKREKIALDVKRGIVSKDEIKVLATNEKIRRSFFGDCASLKVNRAEWSKEYLDKLSYASVAECFNEEYLNYLSDVANHVHSTQKRKSKRKLAVGISAAALIIVAAIVVIIVTNK